MAIGTTITVGFSATAVHAGFKKISAGFKSMTRGFANAGKAMLAPFVKLMAIMAPIIGIGAGISIFKNASAEAASLEMLGTAFEQLLGSAGAAADRMKELEAFSVRTPFEPAEVMKASKLLQTLGGSVLATGEGLEMVGDAAAVAGQPLEEIALHIGRIFGALTSGTSAGEAVARMQELGLITGTAKNQFEALAAAQKKGTANVLSQAQAIKLLQGVLGKTSGAMEKLSTTFSGRISTLQGSWSALLAAMGKGLNVGLGTLVDDLIAYLPTLTKNFEAIGVSLAKTIETLVTQFQNGTLGDFLWANLEFAAAKFGEMMLSMMDMAAQKLVSAFAETQIGGMLGFKEGTGTFSKFQELNANAFGSAEKKSEISRMAAQPRLLEVENWLKIQHYTDKEILSVLKQQYQYTRNTLPSIPR